MTWTDWSPPAVGTEDWQTGTHPRAQRLYPERGCEVVPCLGVCWVLSPPPFSSPLSCTGAEGR